MGGLAQHLNPHHTPPTQPLPGREAEMQQNAAGGYAFVLDDWQRLRRFLILGSEGGTYYATERALTVGNAEVVQRCVGQDGLRTIATIVAVSEGGLAPRNDAAILALAICAKKGDEPARRAAYEAMPSLCRTGTHLFQFAEAIEALGGWGRGARRAITRWYESKDANTLAYQLVKYRQRNGWTHRDLLRLAHPKPQDSEHDSLYGWLRGSTVLTEGQRASYQGFEGEFTAPGVLIGFGAIQEPGLSGKAAAFLIQRYHLPWEAVPSDLAKDPEVMMALLEGMPVTATLRQLGRYGAAGLLKPFTYATNLILSRFSSGNLRKARVHPMAVLLAMRTYAQGHGMRGSLTWQPVQGVVDALDQAFYDCIPNVPSTGKRILVAIDVSGSMQMNSVSGYPLSAAEAAAAMALITMRVEPQHHVIAFNTGAEPLAVSPRQRINDVLRATNIGGGTDLGVPARYAMQERLAVDGMLVLTDNETWAGSSHPSQVMKHYRRSIYPARLVHAALTATETSAADPRDPLTMECVGLDASMPSIAAGFIAGEV